MAPMTKALRLVRTIPASPERVFEAWTTSEQMERWTCPDPTARVEVDIELRVGGRYLICMEVEGGPFTAFGTYREIDPPRRLVYTWQWKQPHTMEVETVVTVEFLAVEGGTEIRLTHEGFSASSDRDGHETSWKMCTAKLADLVAPQ